METGTALPSVAFHSRVWTHDVIQQAEALPLWQQDYTQLRAGRFEGSIDSVSTPSLQVFREAMNRPVDEQAYAPRDTYVIGVPVLVQGESYWNNVRMPHDALMTMDVGSTLSFRTAEVSEIMAAVVRASHLEAYAEQVEEIDWRQLLRSRAAVEPLAAAETAKLRLLLADALTRLPGDDPVMRPGLSGYAELELDLLAQCVGALRRTSEHAARRDCKVHRYIVNRVRDAVLGCAGDPPSVGELCLQLKISRRTLNHAFLHALGTTPMVYTRNVRLNRVRHDLLRASPKSVGVAHVALRWGFWHMSLFSRYYRELFNELPSDTLRNRSDDKGSSPNTGFCSSS
jgi:AraC family ethanolamine operon transcriptional activator